MTKYVLDNKNADFKAACLNSNWNKLEEALVEKLGGGDENKAWVQEQIKVLKNSQILAVHTAESFIEYYQTYVIGKKAIPLPVAFKMHDLIAMFNRAATSMPDKVMNIEGAGSGDSRWKYDSLPFEELVADPNKRIPIRAETYGELIYGYLELFREERIDENGQRVMAITEFPAIRVSSNYIPPSAVWRWFPVEEDVVRDHWIRQESLISKVKPKKRI